MLLMDKFTLVAEALKNLLETDLRLQVIGIAGDSDSLFAAVEGGRPDVVLFSVYRPFRDGLEIARLLKDAYPTIRIIVLTTNDDAKTAAECVNHWASGYLQLTSSAGLLKAVRTVIHGGRFLAPEFHRRLADARSADARYSVDGALTERQCEVVRQLCVGRTMKEVAARLHISARTVAFHKYRVMAQFGVKSNADLFHLAVHHRIIEI
jgi:DNA-binding NarL/FixJ family response regulator